MIPRKVARRLLDEYLGRIEHAEIEEGEEVNAEGLTRLRDELLEESDLVLRGAENIEQKGRRYLTEGRLSVLTVNPQTGLVVARCKGSEDTYSLGYDPRSRQWRCTCPAPRRCAHLIALRLVMDI